MKEKTSPIIVIATMNKGKQREIAQLFADLNARVYGLNDFPNIREVEETGSTFAENAHLKAVGYALMTRKTTIADDSGLEVDALNGAPGVFSARYGGKNASDSEKIYKLLKEIAAATEKNRTARFCCAVAVADANGKIISEANASCDGTIVYEPRGTNGFGYDPIFQPNDYDQTFGELDAKIKENISHRARAFRKIRHLWEK